MDGCDACIPTVHRLAVYKLHCVAYYQERGTQHTPYGEQCGIATANSSLSVPWYDRVRCPIPAHRQQWLNLGIKVSNFFFSSSPSLLKCHMTLNTIRPRAIQLPRFWLFPRITVLYASGRCVQSHSTMQP